VTLTDRVSDLLRAVSLELVMPRFRALETAQIASKASAVDPEDVVTVVDHEVEARLERDLTALLPGTLVIGEEAASKSPEVLARLSAEVPVWIIDPLDGTKNFVNGDNAFGTIVALVEQGETRGGWIVLPERGQVFSATQGGGTWLDGARLKVPERPPRDRLTGKLYSRFMPPGLAQEVKRRIVPHYDHRPHAASAAIEYTDTLAGLQDFVIYYRLLPWDHTAGALLLAEAGGVVQHLTGERYRPTSPDQVTVVATNAETAARVREWLTEL
jgi:fructose-1,6-bisphosphatase/inositol monophosphatase family enzyme